MPLFYVHTKNTWYVLQVDVTAWKALFSLVHLFAFNLCSFLQAVGTGVIDGNSGLLDTGPRWF